MVHYEISMDRRRLQLDRVHAWLAASYWSPRVRRDIVERAADASIVAGAYLVPRGRQVGYARVVSDGVTFAWLCDVVVDEEHRGRGVATRLLEALHARPDLATVRRWLLATADAHPLYERFGYHVVEPGRWMSRAAPTERWQDPEPAGGAVAGGAGRSG